MSVHTHWRMISLEWLKKGTKVYELDLECTSYPSFFLLLSGTLASSPQSSISQHQHGIAIILQILDDLLKAPYRCQGPPPAPSGLHSPIKNTEVEQSKAESKTGTEKQRTDPLRSTSGELFNKVNY